MINRNRTTLKKLAMAGCALSVMVVAAPAIAQESATFEFDIAEKELGQALTEYGIATGNQVLFNDADVRGKSANGLEGVYTSSEAVERLLDDTGVVYRIDGNGTLLVGSEYVRDASLGEETPPQPFRVAQLDQEEDVRGIDSDEVDEFDDERIEDTIVVTGTSIRGVYPDSSPLDVYTAEDIELSGATTVERFLETLPQNLNSNVPTSAAFGPGSGNPAEGRGIDLRGFGPGTTLTLLNGRRLSSPEGISTDVSLIPVGAIDRVEVLSDGASAVYGSDAIGGVVNFILRDDFEGVELSSTYGFADGGYDRYQGDIAAGTSWGSGGGFISYGHSNQSPLDASDREFSSAAPSPTFLTPREETNSVMATINQKITDRTNVFGTVLYSHRDSENDSTRPSPFRLTLFDGEQEQLFVVAGVEHQLAEDLFFQFDATYLDYSRLSNLETEFSSGTIRFSESDDQGTSLDFTTKIDGRLIDVPGGEARFSLGGGYSEQDFENRNRRPPATDPFSENVFGRDSYFIFAEGFAPLIGTQQDIPGINRLEVSAAVRYWTSPGSVDGYRLADSSVSSRLLS